MNSGELLPGASIDVAQLSKRLGVSKTPLRDAMIRLEAEGIVTILPRIGVVVNRLELEDIRFLFQMLGALEAELLITVFDRFDDACLAKMDELDARMQEALNQDDYKLYTSIHWTFHDMFLDLSGNVFAKRLVTPIRQRYWDFPRIGYGKDWDLMACKEHRQIIKAIRTKNLPEAIEIIKEKHWGFAYNEKFIRQVYFGECHSGQ